MASNYCPVQLRISASHQCWVPWVSASPLVINVEFLGRQGWESNIESLSSETWRLKDSWLMTNGYVELDWTVVIRHGNSLNRTHCEQFVHCPWYYQFVYLYAWQRSQMDWNVACRWDFCWYISDVCYGKFVKALFHELYKSSFTLFSLRDRL